MLNYSYRVSKQTWAIRYLAFARSEYVGGSAALKELQMQIQRFTNPDHTVGFGNFFGRCDSDQPMSSLILVVVPGECSVWLPARESVGALG